jgi:hypothetical protein
MVLSFTRWLSLYPYDERAVAKSTGPGISLLGLAELEPPIHSRHRRADRLRE